MKIIEEQIKYFQKLKYNYSSGAYGKFLVSDNINIKSILMEIFKRFFLYLFDKTKLRKDIIVNILALKILIEENKILKL